nr:hypothetical protein [Pandoravirus massiliensis]
MALLFSSSFFSFLLCLFGGAFCALGRLICVSSDKCATCASAQERCALGSRRMGHPRSVLPTKTTREKSGQPQQRTNGVGLRRELRLCAPFFVLCAQALQRKKKSRDDWPRE